MRWNQPLGAVALALLTLLPTPAFAQEPDAKSLWQQAIKLPAKQQQEALEHLRTGQTSHPLLAALAATAAAADQPQHERGKPPAHKRPKKAVEFPLEVDPLPRRVDYLFGTGTIVRCSGKDAPVPKPAGKPNGKPAVPDLTPLHQALLGAVPDADKALAVLLQRLDHDHGADAFAAFLQSWRNGDESFYEALDRTSGTKDSVFFFDVMLDDFRSTFGHGKGAAALAGGLQGAHDALHDAFLTYRQYRAFREAIAWSLVLPPDIALPARLARYEQKVAGAYSLRQQVVMVAAALDHDLTKVLAAVNDGTPALPQPIWAGKHDPYPNWSAHFAALQTTMIERDGSTDAFLQHAEADRRALATALAKHAAECVHAAAGAGKAH